LCLESGYSINISISCWWDGLKTLLGGIEGEKKEEKTGGFPNNKNCKFIFVKKYGLDGGYVSYRMCWRGWNIIT